VEDVSPDSESELLLLLLQLLLPSLLLLLFDCLGAEESCLPDSDGRKDAWAATSTESSVF
jgi:hypothetical protein